MTMCGDADGMVSGATHTTAATIRPGLQVLRTKDSPLVSSVFFMCLPDKVRMLFSPMYGVCISRRGTGVCSSLDLVHWMFAFASRLSPQVLSTCCSQGVCRACILRKPALARLRYHYTPSGPRQGRLTVL